MLTHTVTDNHRADKLEAAAKAGELGDVIRQYLKRGFQHEPQNTKGQAILERIQSVESEIVQADTEVLAVAGANQNQEVAA
jgi:hypothetical protein